MKNNNPYSHFFSSEELENSFMMISLKGLSENLNKIPFNIQKPHRVKLYSILVITTGIGYHYIDLIKHDFAKGSFLFIAEGQIQSYDFKPGNDGFIISFSEDFLTKTINRSEKLSEIWLYNYHLKRPQIQLRAGEQEHFFDMTKKIYQEYQKNDEFAKEEIIQSLLNLLILKSERIKRAEFTDPFKVEYSDIFFKFKNLTEKKYSETRNAKHYAEMLKISYKHLNNICKLCIKKTAKQFIDDFIVLETKRFLLSSQKSVKDISEHIGFDEPTNFVKYFKKHTGLSPVKYKNKYL